MTAGAGVAGAAEALGATADGRVIVSGEGDRFWLAATATGADVQALKPIIAMRATPANAAERLMRTPAMLPVLRK
jgi:hypothetical protein